MNHYAVAPHSPVTPGRQPPSPSRPPLHPSTALTPRSASLRRESPRSSSRGRLGGPNSGSLLQGGSAGDAQGYKDALRVSLNNQPVAGTSPSDRSVRRGARSPRSEGDRSPAASSVGTADSSMRMEPRRFKSSDGQRIELKPKKRSSASTSESPLYVWTILAKSVYAFILLAVGIGLGALVVTGSFDWLYDVNASVSPFVSCPTTVEVLASNSVMDGSSCELRFSFDSYTAFQSSVTTAFQPHNTVSTGDSRCVQRQTFTDCSASSPCQVRCFSSDACTVALGSGSCTSASGFLWGSAYNSGAASSCFQTVQMSGVQYPVEGASISAEPLCGVTQTLTPGMITTLRGEFVAIFVLSVLVTIALIVKAKVAPVVRTGAVSQKGLMIAKASAAELKAGVEARWDTEFTAAVREAKPPAAHNGPKFETGSFNPVPRKDPPTHPAKLFAATSWKYRVRVMHAMMKKRSSRVKREIFFSQLLSALLLISLTFGVTVLLLVVLPGTYPFNAVITSTTSSGWTGGIESITSPLYTGFGSLAKGVWIDALSLADLAVELILLLGMAVLGGHASAASPVVDSAEGCVVILMSAGTCLKTRGRDKLVDTVKAGLERVGTVFVVDMGASNAPMDDTWKIVTSLGDQRVHYAYLPDTNKRLGLFWLAQTWIPFLHKSGRVSTLFERMVVVDLDQLVHVVGVGGKSDLPAIAGENQVMLIPVKSDLPGWLGVCETMRLKSEFGNRRIEAGFTKGAVLSTGPAGNAVCVIDRRAVDVEAHASPVQHALALLRKRVAVTPAVAATPVSVQNSIYNLYCDQAETLPNTLSYVRELFSVSSWSGFALKLIILLGPVVGVVITLLRPLILGTLLFRDPFCLACILVGFWILSVACSLLRGGRKGIFATYPMYQLYLGTIKVGLVVSGATFGRLHDQEVRPACESSQKELYPCLPHAEVDWFTCWKISDASRLSALSSAAADTISADSIV